MVVCCCGDRKEGSLNTCWMFMFARAGDSTQLMPYASLSRSGDRWAAEGMGAANGALHLICEKLGVQAMKTSWALLAV